MKKCKRYICEQNCDDFSLQNKISCAKICDHRVNSPFSDFGKVDIGGNLINYPIPIYTFKNNFIESTSIFTDGCNSNDSRQFQWRFTNQNGELIYQTPLEFGNASFLTGTYDSFYTGENDYDIIEFILNNSLVTLDSLDTVFLQLNVVDCKGDSSNVLSNAEIISLENMSEIWAERVLSEYLLINEHVNSSGNDIVGRELTASQKQYIYDRAVDTLWSRFGFFGATIVQRTASEMAQSFYYFQRIAGDLGNDGTTTNLVTGKTAISVCNTTVFDNSFDLFPRFLSPVDYGCLIVTRENSPANYWSEVLNYSTLFRDYILGGSRRQAFSNAIFPILRHPNPIDNYRIMNSGEFVGIMPNLYRNVDLNAAGQAVQLIASPNGSTSFSNLDGINLTFIARCTWGIRIRGNGLDEQALKDIIDVFYSLRNTTLNAGGVLDLRQNTGSTAIANDPVYAAKLDDIAIDAGWSISI